VTKGRVYTAADIRKALEDRNLTAVSMRTGLHAETLYRIVRGTQKGMALGTYSVLVEYLFGTADDGE
jgi:hypothetical protein